VLDADEYECFAAPKPDLPQVDFLSRLGMEGLDLTHERDSERDIDL